MLEFLEASRWSCPLESHLCTSFDLQPISKETWLPVLLPGKLPYPGGVEEAPLGGAPTGGEG